MRFRFLIEWQGYKTAMMSDKKMLLRRERERERERERKREREREGERAREKLRKR